MRPIKFAMGLLLLSLIVSAGGCMGQAGLTTDLLTYDNVIAAANETKKVVVAYDTAVQTLDAGQQAALLAHLQQGIIDSLVGEYTLEEAKVIAAEATASFQVALVNFQIEERRRAKLFEIAMDNLAYIIQICDAGKKFSMYRADVSAQWRAYLESSAKNYITPAPTE